MSTNQLVGIHKVINKLVTYEKCKRVVVYTNAKIVPKGENLSCLKNKKVLLEMLSRAWKLK